MTFTGPRSTMELWHPTGLPHQRLFSGPDVGADASDEGGSGVDIAFVAAAGHELTAQWLRRSLAEATRRLAADGLLWIIVPPRWRRTAGAAVSGAGLTLVDAVLTGPGWPIPRHLVPLSAPALRHAGAHRVGMNAATAAAAARIAATPAGRRLLRDALPSCALVAARPGTAAPLRWLGELDGRGVATAVVSAGFRRDARTAVAMRVPPGGEAPDVAVKVALDAAGRERLLAERSALERLGADAVRAGADVPMRRPGTADAVLVTQALPGGSAAGILARRPRRLVSIVTAVADWLLAWNRAGARNTTGNPRFLEDVLLAPAARVAAADPALGGHLEAMQRLAKRLGDRPLVVTPAHNDLTLANVLTGVGRIGILDWESATDEGLPLVDLWYVLADAIARADRVSHARAVEKLVSPAPHRAAAGLVPRHAAALSLDGDQALLGFHACWLGHAENELRRNAPGPFLEVVRTVAANQLLWP